MPAQAGARHHRVAGGRWGDRSGDRGRRNFGFGLVGIAWFGKRGRWAGRAGIAARAANPVHAGLRVEAQNQKEAREQHTVRHGEYSGGDVGGLTPPTGFPSLACFHGAHLYHAGPPSGGYHDALFRERALSDSVPALDAHVLAAALPARMRPQLHVREVVDSTQQVLLDATAAWPDRSVVVTDCQSAGRGRRGRVWQSPAGASLALSMRVHRDDGQRWGSGVSLALGVATAQVLQRLGAVSTRLKWPNDLVVAQRKLGGILVESCGTGVVAGVGINLALPAATREAIAQPCADLDELGCHVGREALAAALIEAWNEAFDVFLAQGLAPFLTHWQALDALAHVPVRVLAGEQVIEGVACGIDAQGFLLVEVAGQRRAFSSAEVSVRPA